MDAVGGRAGDCRSFHGNSDSAGGDGKTSGYCRQFDDDIIGGTRAIARNSLIIYTLLTLAGILLLILLGTDWYSSILYVLSAVSTGGFSPHDASLQGLGSGYARAGITAVSMAGAVTLIFYHRAWHRGWRDAVSDRQIQAFFIMAVTITLLLSGFLWYQDGLAPLNALAHGTLNGLSALSTAGFLLCLSVIWKTGQTHPDRFHGHGRLCRFYGRRHQDHPAPDCLPSHLPPYSARRRTPPGGACGHIEMEKNWKRMRFSAP